MTPYNLGLAACALLAVGVLVRFYMLPRPIPGIPYHKASAKRILGDMPDVSHEMRVDTWTEPFPAHQISWRDKGNLGLHSTIGDRLRHTDFSDVHASVRKAVGGNHRFPRVCGYSTESSE